MKLKPYLPLLLITVIGGLLRFYGLSHFPVSLNWDEVSHGYNAYSILKTGRDEWGKSFPLIFRAFGDFKLPLYIYLSTIPVWLFGLTPFAVRFVSALAGTLAIPGIFLLTRELFPKRVIPDSIRNLYKETPIVSAFILTFLPWHFFISRPALEANLSLTLIIFGFYYLLKFFRTNSGRHPDQAERVEGSHSTSLLPAALLLGLSLHSYNTARIFVPLLVLATFIIYLLSFRPKWRNLTLSPKNLLAIIIFLLFSGLVLYQVLLGEGTARYEKLKILSPSAVFQIGEKRTQSDLPPLLARAVHNRPVYFVTTFAKNYLDYFSPDFFSQRWGAQYQFAIPGQSLLTLPIFLLAFLGFFSHLRQIKPSVIFQFLYIWLLLSPVAAGLTADPPQALRPNPMIPALVIFAVLGLSRLMVIIPENRKQGAVAVIGIWFIVLFGLFVRSYATDYKDAYSSSWQYGYRQVIEYAKAHRSEYDRVFITKRYGEPHIFYALYTALSPDKMHPGGNNVRYEKSDWFWTDRIENTYFINDWEIPLIEVKTLPLESGEQISTERSLLITSPDHVPVNTTVKETVNFLDGSPAFIISSVQ